MAQHIFSGSGAPATTPSAVGHHYIDTLNDRSYISVGTSSSADWQLTQASGSYITALTGDVTATGPGSASATVAQVGGQTAAAVASATVDVGNATSSNISNTIVERDGSGNFSAGTITATLSGNASNVSGIVAIANGGTGQTNATAALNNLLPVQTGNAGKVLGTDGSNPSWVVDAGTPTGTPDTFAGYDGAGNLNPITGWGQTALVGMAVNHTYAPAGGSGTEDDHRLAVFVEPSANSPNRSVNLLSLQAYLDNASSGFSFGGPTDASIRMLPMNVSHQGTGDVGDISFINTNFNIGNGTDPISVNGISYAYGFGTVNANVTLTNQIQGYGFQPNVNASAIMNNSATAFYDNANIGCPIPGYTSIGIYPQIAEIENNNNYLGINIGTTISSFDGNAGATGIGIFGTYAAPASWQGIVINPTVSGSTTNYAVGLNVTMDNVTVYAGVAGSVTVQDLTYTWNTPGEDANSYSVEYVGGGTAGSESVSLLGNIITIQIEDTVSTANQIKAAIEAVPQINAALTVTVSGTGTNTQTIDGPDAFTGGQWPGNKYAAQFDGNVSIDGALSFTGALSVGELQAYYSEALTDGGGTPSSGHSLITAPTVAASTTVANADYLAVNTASLINIGANATVTTAFLGVSAMGLPAVLTMGAGSTLDRVSGGVFALSLDPAGSTGTVDQVAICRALALPNGVTTVNRFYGYEVSLPFGAVGTDAWGIYVTPDIDNWLKGSLRIGGTTISDDQTATGNKLHVDGNSFLDGALESTGNVGFFGVTPVAQQASSGAATAGGTYTATEQAMLQEAYDALRAYGLLS